ncbi:amino acid adenylation domain-containing protein [Gordonia sp. X0973]|uniref:non-ribosomal peptide synthetase n=1 Tax=Gordonia sp. X0973 TaxID=2742602 RepID=UPI000F546E34|nr:non-ribosomal peptide synthetase [Gordonia sp. X0973]QKT05899.1 amino acid adenylation domain-containing protein [Gordonia sp. X0973]
MSVVSSDTATQIDVRAEVAAVLGVEADSLNRDADLVMHGLDSLRVMRLAGQWRKRGFDVDFARLAADPTLDAWAALLGADAAEWAPQVRRVGTPSAPSGHPGGTEWASGTFPLAPMQHAYWVGRSDSHALGGVAAHLYVEFDGDSPVDAADRFTAAVDALAQRHPMLRTRVNADGTQTVGNPHPECSAVYDLRASTVEEVDAELARRREQGTHRMLPVEEGEMFRAELTLLPGGRSRIHLDVDMLAADAMSYRVLVDDLAQLYRGGELKPLTSTYEELSQTRSAQPAREADIEWWRARLADLPGAPELPRTEAALQDGHARTVRLHHRVDAADWSRLETHARTRGVTPAAAVAAAFAEAVGTRSASSRFLLTVPMFDRDTADPNGEHPDLERVVGDFTSSILVAVDLSRPATLAERAAAMRDEMHDAMAHGSFGGLDVLRELSRFQGEPVVSPVVFTSALGLGELFSDAVRRDFGSPSWIVSQGPQVLLDAQVTEVEGGLLLNWDVRTSELPREVAEAMFAYYVRALDQLVAGEWDAPAPDPVDEPTRAVRAGVEKPLPRTDVFDGTLHGRFVELAAQRAEAPALITDARTWSHADLVDEARRVAGALIEAGVSRGDTVIVNLPKGGQQVVAAIGVLLAGGAYVPINPNQPAARRERILTVAEPAAILTDDPSRWPAAAGVLDFATAVAHTPAEPVEVTGDDLAYVLFTSGSTGLPKGVELPHRAAVATLTDLVERLRLTQGDRSLMVSSLEFDLSVFDVFALLAVGGSVVVPDDAGAGKADDWVRLLAEQQVTVLNCVPSILGMILDLGPLAPSVREIIMGGDKVDVSLLERVAQQSPHCRAAGLGGTTETAIHSTYCAAADIPPGFAFVPYGFPLAGVACRVVDEQGRDRPDFVPGELWIGGAGVAAGYRADAERTADRFVEHDGQRWYRTGDLARYLPGGFLDFLGRADHLVKVRGYRIELGEVEAALLRQAVVTGAVAWSDGRDLRAAITVDDEASTADEVRAALAADLPEHMIPRSVIALSELPLTGNGKYDRKKVAELSVADEPTGAAAPRTPVEEVLVDVLGGVLGTDRIGVHDDFLALGGDSVLATRFVAQTREWLDVPRLSVADVFANRTVAGLAERIVGLDPDVETAAAEYLEVMAMSDDEVAAELQSAEWAPESPRVGTSLSPTGHPERPLRERLTHVPMDADAHTAIIREWLNHPKSKYWEMLTASHEEVATMIRDAQTGEPYGMRLGLFDGQPQFLFELYDPTVSELADPSTGYVHADGDIGMHLLVAPTDEPIAGFTAEVMLHIISTAFFAAGAQRVVVEPDVRNSHVQRLNAGVGFTVAGDYPVGKKTARLSYCTRDDFTRLTDNGRRIAQ